MKNDETRIGNVDAFEQQLMNAPLRVLPSEWRSEILSAAAEVNRRQNPRRESWLSTLNNKLSTIFWPHPVAWAGLAAIWIFIFAVNISIHDNAPVIAKKEVPPTPEAVVELRQQRKMFAELMGANETHDADRQRVLSPKPRSEYAAISTA